MPSKKNKKTGVNFYIDAVLVPEKQREGYQFRNGIATLMPEALTRFKELPPHERQMYEQMARDHRERNKDVVADGRRDNCGKLISERKDPREMVQLKRKSDRQTMRQMFPADLDALKDMKFYTIGFEYMVALEKSDEELEYMPCEVGIVEWSMRSGISREFHDLINPGDIPLGYRFKFQEHSDETHRFTIDDIRKGENNYTSVWMRMESFVFPETAGSAYRVVHCMVHEMNKIHGCLSWLHQRAMCGPNRFNVRAVEDLSMELFAHANMNVSESSAIDMLTTTAFDYEPNTRCRLHDNSETRHCALAAAKRYTMAMSDALSSIYEFELTPNHLPTRNIARQQYVAIGPNQEQLVPQLRSVPAGRGCSVESGQFSSRDIRYTPGIRIGAGESNSDEPVIPRAASALPTTSVRLNPPPACRMPAQPYNTAGIEQSVRNMAVGNGGAPALRPPPQSSQRHVMPTDAYPRAGAAGGGPTIRPPVIQPAADWRNPVPWGGAGLSTGSAAPPSAPRTGIMPASAANDSDDDDDLSSLMSGTTGMSSNLTSIPPPPHGRGYFLFPNAYPASEYSVGSSSVTLPYGASAPSEYSTGMSSVTRPPVGRGSGIGRGQLLDSAQGRGMPPPPGFRGSDAFA